MVTRNRRPGKEDGCCSVNFLKYVMFIFNFVFYLAGIAILGIALWTLFFKSHYVVLLTSKTYSATTYVLLVAGILVLLFGLVGCFGVAKESRPILLLFTFCLLLIFLIEVVASMLAYFYSEQIGKELQNNFQRTLQNKYGVDSAVTDAANLLQTNHACCGAADFRDWRLSAWYNTTNATAIGDPILVPYVCCKSIRPDDLVCGRRDHPSNIYYDGCVSALRDEIKQHQVILGAAAFGISTVQIFGMIISCCLYVKLKDFEDLSSQRKKRTNNTSY